LVARLVDERGVEHLADVASRGAVVYVRLTEPPTELGMHHLEVRHGANAEVLLLVAEVLGPATEAGSPLRLRLPHTVSAKRQTSSYAGDAARPRVPIPPRSDPSDPLVGRTLASGKLTIEARVGEGGAGTVYRARHRDLQMAVAVKVMHENLQRDERYCVRFHAEALSASRLDHANLTRVLDYGQEPDGLLYLAMEFLDGTSLRDVLEEGGAMPFERAARILAMVCSGLTHAHARGVVHRDVKPENIVLVRGLDDDGHETEIAKVCDFGIAHRASAGKAVLAGTAEYASPEQLRGDEPDVQSDVYSCGVVLYELLTGTVPIAGSFPDIVPKVLGETPPPPSRRIEADRPPIDPRVDRLVMKAISKDREVRHASVRELRAEIRALAEDMAVFTAGGYYEVEAPTSTRSRLSSKPTGDEAPEWLERGTGYLASMTPSAPPASSRVPIARAMSSHPPGSAAGGLPRTPSSSSIAIPSIGPTPGGAPLPSIVPGSHVSLTPSMAPDASEAARDVAGFVRRLVDTEDAAAFRVLVAPMDAKIRELFAQGHVGPAWRLCSALDMIARERSERAAHARVVLAVFSDRTILAALAEKALDFLEDKDGSARKLVVRAGNVGAHVLYSARVRHSVFEARERFVAILGEIGRLALPTFRAALERLEGKLTVAGAVSIAEDLLRALPDTLDEELGATVARYTKSDVNSLAHLSTLGLPKVWGARARPILVGLLHHRSDDVAIAAIKRLRTLATGVDVDLVEHLRPLILGAAGARPAVRLAAVEALEGAKHRALDDARALAGAALLATQGTGPEIEDLVVVLANTVVTLGGDVSIVAARWRQSHPWLRTRLEAALKRAKLPGR
jgi:serine/threonine-protein kinase